MQFLSKSKPNTASINYCFAAYAASGHQGRAQSNFRQMEPAKTNDWITKTFVQII
jgi:hypothetical protein